MLATTLTLLALLGGGEGDKAKAVRVICKADADIRGTEVLLRDLAEVSTPDDDLTARLLRISFGRRPAYGFSRVLSRRDILRGALASGALVPLLEDFETPPVPVHVVHHEGRHATRKVRTFVDLAVSTLRANPALR